MSNHETFPWWRLKNHIIIIFRYDRFSSCRNTYANRKYLIESDYLDKARAVIYPDKIMIYHPEDFKDLAKWENQEEDVSDDKRN